MNKIVETVDDGLHKTKGRGLWNRIRTRIGKLFGKDTSEENSGEQNTKCLRTIQEEFQANIAAKSMVMCKNLGFLPDDWENAKKQLTAHNWNNGGWQEDFYKNVAEPANLLSGYISKE